MSGADFNSDDWGGGGGSANSGGGGGFNLGGAIGGLGSIVGGFFGNQADQAAAQGDFAAAQEYQTGANIAQENEKIEEDIGRLQTFQIRRQVQQTTGQGYAQEGANGFMAGTGSGYYIARQNAMQGALAVGLNQTQTALQVGGYAEQKTALLAESQQANAAGQAAEAAGQGSLFGGILGGIGQIFSSFL